MGKTIPKAYDLLAGLRVLSTHYIGFFEKIG